MDNKFTSLRESKHFLREGSAGKIPKLKLFEASVGQNFVYSEAKQTNILQTKKYSIQSV